MEPAEEEMLWEAELLGQSHLSHLKLGRRYWTLSEDLVLALLEFGLALVWYCLIVLFTLEQYCVFSAIVYWKFIICFMNFTRACNYKLLQVSEETLEF